MEPKHNLLVSHILSILLVDEDDVVSVLGSRECKVNLVEDERVVVIEVCVTTRVDHPCLDGH